MKPFITALLLLLTQYSYGQTVVVVGKNSQIESLTVQLVENIFLARTTRFPNGDKAQPIELKDNVLRDNFYKNISGKSSKQLYAYWTTLVFTGKGKPPRAYSDSKDIQAKLLEQPGSITYLPLSQVTDEMKIVYSFP
ncbi:hypothetical protein tinsulaeT_23960 [Thalassotalea insulae]|uniref:Phosphate ABC transporter substrate-binding protein n=1 Tax=Thalassotalea insulae TaxID=2056778 RepID=A0ABQ6GXZ2_9GAMM|nr:hypothetical protein [Thalassotalea insulae]GLX79056.1 hypothetical protein tinsulaeT_23960 [Thalassotalea insulae]